MLMSYGEPGRVISILKMGNEAKVRVYVGKLIGKMDGSRV